MKTTTNAQRLHLLLDSGRAFTLKELQAHLQVGERQIRRLLDQLEASGVTLHCRQEGRYKSFYIDEQDQRTTLSDLHFSQAELRSLTLAVKASQTVLAGTPHTGPLHSVFDKLLERVTLAAYSFDTQDQLNEWHFEEEEADQIAQDNFRCVEKCITERRSVYIDYTTASSQQASADRKIDPYVITKRGRSWMVVGYCHKRKGLRNFALIRVSRAVPCDPEQEKAYFTIPEDFVAEEHFRGALGAINSDTCYVLRLLVEPEKARYFQDRTYHPSQTIEEEHSDGRLVVSYELEGFEEMRSFCQGWGTGITVLDPSKLRERLLQEAKVVAERYESV